MKKDHFHTSTGWVDKFKKQFGISLLSTTGEKLSCVFEAFELCKEKFMKVLKKLDLSPANL